MTFSMAEVSWRPCYRIIPSRFPPIELFERVNSDPGERDLLNELEGQTSARLREEAGDIQRVPEKDRRFGPGWTPVMAAFCHVSSGGSRFSDGSFGVYYCALTEATAIAETRYHAEQFMRESAEPPMLLQQRVVLSNLEGRLIDLRPSSVEAHHLLTPDSWARGQAFGQQARADDQDGIVYPSVRDPAGECAAVLRPPVLSATHQGQHLGYEWDGERIRHVLALSLVE